MFSKAIYENEATVDRAEGILHAIYKIMSNIIYTSQTLNNLSYDSEQLVRI